MSDLMIVSIIFLIVMIICVASSAILWNSKIDNDGKITRLTETCTRLQAGFELVKDAYDDQGIILERTTRDIITLTGMIDDLRKYTEEIVSETESDSNKAYNELCKRYDGLNSIFLRLNASVVALDSKLAKVLYSREYDAQMGVVEDVKLCTEVEQLTQS